MRKFHCQCGQRVFFDSYSCVACGATLGFDPVRLRMVTVYENQGSVLQAAGQSQLGFTPQNYAFCGQTVNIRPVIG